MNRGAIAFLNLILIVVGFFIIYASPLNVLAVTLGMFFIATSIISFAVMIYFPPPQPAYIKLKVIEETPKIPRRVKRKRPKKRARRRKR